MIETTAYTATTDAALLADYCLKHLNLNDPHYAQPYGSFGPCILDCIYSLRTKYFPVTVSVLQRYGSAFMDGDAHKAGYTLTDFVRHIQSSNGTQGFANTVLHNRQRLSGRLKSEVCLEFAEKLIVKGIETKEDFAAADANDMTVVMRSVRGMGDAAINYMFMLAGDPTRCKPDVHIHHCIRDAIGRDVSNEMCQLLFSEAARILNKEYLQLTVASLDGLVWSKYRSGSGKQ